MKKIIDVREEKDPDITEKNKNYIETWENVDVDQDPLLKLWKEYVDNSERKCGSKKNADV